MRHLILSILLTIICSACNDDDDSLSEADKLAVLLSRSWSVASVELDGENITRFGYSQFELTFSRDGIWNAVNGGDILGTSGAWSVIEENGAVATDKISMSGREVNIIVNDQAQYLQLSFQFSGEKFSGRTQSINGNYILYFLPKYAGD